MFWILLYPEVKYETSSITRFGSFGPGSTTTTQPHVLTSTGLLWITHPWTFDLAKDLLKGYCGGGIRNISIRGAGLSRNPASVSFSSKFQCMRNPRSHVPGRCNPVSLHALYLIVAAQPDSWYHSCSRTKYSATNNIQFVVMRSRLSPSYTNVFDTLMQWFRDLADRDTLINVHHIGESVPLSWMFVDTRALDIDVNISNSLRTFTNLWTSRRFGFQGHGIHGRCWAGYIQLEVLSPLLIHLSW